MASDPQKPGDGQILRPSLRRSGLPTPGPWASPRTEGRACLSTCVGCLLTAAPASTGDEPHGLLEQVNGPFSVAPVVGVSCSRWGWALL